MTKDDFKEYLEKFAAAHNISVEKANEYKLIESIKKEVVEESKEEN